MSFEWAEWRNSIRVTSDEAIIAIENATDVDGVSEAMSNVVWPPSPLLLEIIPEENLLVSVEEED